jgi:hypothetical protein
MAGASARQTSPSSMLGTVPKGNFVRNLGAAVPGPFDMPGTASENLNGTFFIRQGQTTARTGWLSGTPWIVSTIFDTLLLTDGSCTHSVSPLVQRSDEPSLFLFCFF